MNNLTRLTAVGLVLIAITLLFVMLSGRDAHSEETRYNFVNILSVGNDVALDTLDGAARIIIAPSKDFWQRADKQRGLFHRGVVTGVYEDYVSIRVVDEHGVDPLVPGPGAPCSSSGLCHREDHDVYRRKILSVAPAAHRPILIPTKDLPALWWPNLLRPRIQRVIEVTDRQRSGRYPYSRPGCTRSGRRKD